MRARTLNTYVMALMLLLICGAANANQPVIRGVGGGFRPAQPVVATAATSVRRQDAQADAPLNGTANEMRDWLLAQSGNDQDIFKGLDNPLESQADPLAIQAPPPRAAPPEPVQATRLNPSAPAGMPIIRAVLSKSSSLALFAPGGPAAGALGPLPCAWPLPCKRPPTSFGRNRTPSDKAMGYARRARLNMTAYAAEITEAANRYALDPSLLRAVIHAESSFNHKARSPVGAQGLMQLMPATAKRFGVTNSYDARQNIGGGAAYLAWLLRRFKGDQTLAAAAYNAGEGAVDRHKGIPPYRETIDYVGKVTTLLYRYQGSRDSLVVATR